MKTSLPSHAARRRAGFTLFEVLISSSILVVAVAGLLSTYVLIQRMWHSNAAAVTATARANTALERIVYGADAQGGLRAASLDSVSFASNSTTWQVNYNTNRFLRYSKVDGTIVNENGFVLCRDIVRSSAEIAEGGLSMGVVVAARSGTFTSTNEVVSYVKFRN